MSNSKIYNFYMLFLFQVVNPTPHLWKLWQGTKPNENYVCVYNRPFLWVMNYLYRKMVIIFFFSILYHIILYYGDKIDIMWFFLAWNIRLRLWNQCQSYSHFSFPDQKSTIPQPMYLRNRLYCQANGWKISHRKFLIESTTLPRVVFSQYSVSRWFI